MKGFDFWLSPQGNKYTQNLQGLTHAHTSANVTASLFQTGSHISLLWFIQYVFKPSHLHKVSVQEWFSPQHSISVSANKWSYLRGLTHGSIEIWFPVFVWETGGALNFPGLYVRRRISTPGARCIKLCVDSQLCFINLSLCKTGHLSTEVV